MNAIRILILIAAGLVASFSQAEDRPDHKLHWENRTENIEWKAVMKNKEKNMWIMEMAPATSAENDYSNLLVVQAFIKTNNFSLESWSSRMIIGYQKNCTTLKVDALKDDGAIGYDQQSFFFMCGQKLDTDYGVYTFIKAMKKDNILYVVLREFHVPSSPIPGTFSVPKDAEIDHILSDTANAVRYLFEDVYLCGPDIIHDKCQ